MILKVDLGTQDHIHSFYDLSYLRLYTRYILYLGVDSNICKVDSNMLDVRNLRKSILNYITLMVDLDFQGQTNLFQIFIIFEFNHHSYIICFRFSEFLDLDYVKINTKIKSVACIQPEIKQVIWKYVRPWFSRSTMEVRRHMLVILRFQTSDVFDSTPTLCLYHVYNPWWTKGHNKYLWPWFSRLSFFFKTYFGITHGHIRTTRCSLSRKPIYNSKKSFAI